MSVNAVPNNINKEMGRLLGMGEVTSYTSYMNPTGHTISDRDIAVTRTLYLLGKSIYKNFKQDLPRVSWLRDSSTMIPSVPMM